MAKLKRAVGLVSRDPVVLLVDDEPTYLESLVCLLSREALHIKQARSGLHALEVLQSQEVDVVVADYWMIGMDGITLLNEVQRLYPETRRVLLTGAPDSEIVLEAKAHKVLTKDMRPELIRQSILRAARRKP